METATTKDDSLDTVAEISTEVPGPLTLGVSSSDLRGTIDKKSGVAIYRLVQVIQYDSNGWRFFDSVNVETLTGPRSLPVMVASRDVTNCVGNNCTFIEQLAVTLDEPLLRAVAAKYVPGQRATWKFKFSPKTGDDITYTMAAAKVAGFMDRMDEYTSAHAFSLKPIVPVASR